MDKRILISETSRETRIAVLENGELVEFFVEKFEKSRLVGNIYLGQVENVIKGIQAAFVDIGMEKNAFLPFAEIGDPEAIDSLIENIKDSQEEKTIRQTKKKSRRDLDKVKLKKGQEILVQVIKEPFGDKGPRVTTDISIPGRFLVLIPYVEYVGISKKIKNRKTRYRLKKIVDEIKPKGFGVIVRTVADDIDQEVLESDLNTLLKNWKKLENLVRKIESPECVFQDMETASTVIRDFLSHNVSKIIVDKKSLYIKLNNYIKTTSPEYSDVIEYYNSKTPLFDQMNVEKEFQKSLYKKVWLNNGGFIVIEHTEAMTTIDVNSGKFISKKDHHKIALKTNMLAAKEVAKQLRLRDIGGLIVIDFIDMVDMANRNKVYNELKTELAKAKASIALASISEFGLLEMTRQRIRTNLLHTVSEQCPLCHGSGRITSKASVVTMLEGWFSRFRHQSKERRVELYIHPDMAEYLKVTAKNIIRKIQWKYLMRIKVIQDISVNVDDFKVFSIKEGIEITDKY